MKAKIVWDIQKFIRSSITCVGALKHKSNAPSPSPPSFQRPFIQFPEGKRIRIKAAQGSSTHKRNKWKQTSWSPVWGKKGYVSWYWKQGSLLWWEPWFAQFSIMFYQVKFIFASKLDYFGIVHKLLTSQWAASLPDLKTIILTDLSNQRFLQSPVMAWLQTCHRNIQIKNQYQQRLNKKNIH